MKLKLSVLLCIAAVFASACSDRSVPSEPIFRAGASPVPVASGASPTAMPSAATPGSTTMPATATPAPATTATSAATAAPTSMPSASPVPVATASSSDPSVVAVTNAYANVQTYYQTLPHTDPVADVAAVASEMVTSGHFTSASVGPGGITGTLPDGSQALVFADREEDLGVAPQIAGSGSARAGARAAFERRPNDIGSIGAGSAHEIAFFSNAMDRSTFQPMTDAKYATAFVDAGFVQPNYSVDVASVTLDNIGLLTNGHPIDYLNVATHGMIAVNGTTNTFWLDSDTPVNAQTKAQYQTEFGAHQITYAYVLTTDPNPIVSTTFALNIPYLTSHLHFNPGSVVYFGACFSASPLIVDATSASFQSVGVGRYYGWTKATLASDEYESNAFLIDRVLGEQSPVKTGLDAFATQRVPPQRAFDFDDTFGAMQKETRAGPIYFNQTTTYAISNKPQFQQNNVNQQPLGDGSASTLIATGPNGPTLPDTSFDSATPSVSTMSIVESPTSGTLTINGRFPAAPGTVQIADGSGTTQLTVTSWTTSSISALLPASGNGSAGLVTVTSALGIVSNAVPLTQWHGNLTYLENDSIPDLGSTTGTGSGSLSASFAIDFRADVHPYVNSIDTVPLPQQFGFTYTEGDATGQLQNYSGSYTSTSEKTAHTATFSNATPGPTLVAATPPLGDNTFELRSFSDQPSPCNSGDKTSGTISTSSDPNVFCPLLGFVADPGQIVCTDDDDGALCDDEGYTGFVAYSGPFDALGLLTFTLDPKSYAIAVQGEMSSFTSAQFYGTDRPATAQVTGSIGTPSYPPAMTTTAARVRRPAPDGTHRRRAAALSPDETAAAARYRALKASRRR